MAGQNMEDFIRATALILDSLFQQFPQEIMLDVRKFGAQESNQNKFENFRSTVVFLKRGGFIRFSSEAGDSAGLFARTVLTLKGLKVLSSVPDVLKDKKSLGEQISKAVKEGSVEIIKTLIMQVIHKGMETLSGA